MTHPHMSPFQFSNPDGASPTLPDFPGLTLHTVEGQGSAVGRDWAKELDMPTYFEEWEALAKCRSDRLWGRVTFVVFDESATRLPGHPRLKPRQIALPFHCSLELGHEGFLVGQLCTYVLRASPSVRHVQLEGECLMAEAAFFDSPLAEKAVEGLTRGLFTHVCPVLWAPPGVPVGTGMLVQVSLVPGDYPGCPNARVLEWSE